MDPTPQSTEATSVLQVYRRIFGHILPYRTRFVLGLCTALLAGASTGALYVALKTVTALVLRGKADLSVTIPVLGKLDAAPLFDRWIQGDWQTANRVAFLCLVVPAIVLLRGLFDFLAVYQLAWVEQRITLDLRRQVFSKVMARSPD
jgi:ABC-type multidrug transport system fused ATPase/permease subunit